MLQWIGDFWKLAARIAGPGQGVLTKDKATGELITMAESGKRLEQARTKRLAPELAQVSKNVRKPLPRTMQQNLTTKFSTLLELLAKRAAKVPGPGQMLPPSLVAGQKKIQQKRQQMFLNQPPTPSLKAQATAMMNMPSKGHLPQYVHKDLLSPQSKRIGRDKLAEVMQRFLKSSNVGAVPKAPQFAGFDTNSVKNPAQQKSMQAATNLAMDASVKPPKGPTANAAPVSTSNLQTPTMDGFKSRVNKSQGKF